MVGLSVVGRRPWFSGVLAGAMMVGCGLDIAGGSGGDGVTAGDTDTAESGPPGTTGAEPDSDTDDNETASGTAGPSVGESTGDLGEPCELDCGVNGYCELGDSGLAQCTCDDGYASTGLACIPCTTIEGALDANVPIVDAVIELRVGGVEPPAAIQDSGRVFLRNTASGDEVVLGSTFDGTVTKTIIPGNYEVYYSKLQGGTAIPVNANALVTTMIIDDAEPLVVDIPVATVTGRFTIAGEEPTDSPYDFGRIYLVDPVTGDEALLGATRDRSFIVNVIPGQYEIRYRLGQAETEAPKNHDARLGRVEIHPAGEVLQELEIDVPAVDVQGAITVAGAEPPAVVQDYGRIVFVDTRTGDRIEVGTTRDGTWASRLVSGSYDVFYERVAGGVGVPINQHAFLSTVALDGSGVVDIDVPAVPLSGTFTVDGAAPPSSASDDGIVVLRNATGDTAHLGNTHDGSFAALVVPGTYEVFYAQETAGTVMPGNTNARVRQLKVQAAGPRTLDIPVAHVSGTLAVSGDVPPESVYDDGRVYLRNHATGDSVLLGNTRLAQYAATVVPGTYDVVYEAEISDDIVPVNKAAEILSDVVVRAGDMTLDIDVPVATVAGQILVDSAMPPQSETERGNLYLEDLHSADLIFLGSTVAPSFDRPLATGRYLLRYRGQSGGDVLPANGNAGIACYDVVAK